MVKMNKPEKIYLNNPNLVNSLTDTLSNQGTLRKTFFVNQLQVFYKINSSDEGDFRVNDKYTFEIGSKNKNSNKLQESMMPLLPLTILNTPSRIRFHCGCLDFYIEYYADP